MDDATASLPISVVIGAHNAAPFVLETLASIARQTRAPREVIVVDDGSSDGTAELAEASGALVVRQSQSGPGSARNAGVARATCDFIAFCDADDLWHETKLERQWTALQILPQCEIAFCDYYDFSDAGLMNPSVIKASHTHVRQAAFAPAGQGILLAPRARLNAMTLEQQFALPSTWLVKRATLEAVGAFRSDLRIGEDAELLLRIFTRSDGAFVDEPLMGYRRHGRNLTADARRSRYSSVVQAAAILANPERYRPETRTYYERNLPALLFKAGRMFASYGNLALAALLLRASLRYGPSPAAAAWFLIAPLFVLPFFRQLVAGRRSLRRSPSDRATRLRAT